MCCWSSIHSTNKLSVLTLALLLQTDLACEFGYEMVGDECVQLPGLETMQCPSLETGNYTISQSHKRLIQGDVCEGLERLINDTDGKGNLVPTSSGHGGWALWLGIAVVSLIWCCAQAR